MNVFHQRYHLAERKILSIYMKAHDIVILAKLCQMPQRQWTQKELSSSLKISQAEISYALNRMENSKLYDKASSFVMINNFLEFLRYGFNYVFPAVVGAEKVGIPLKGLQGMQQNRLIVWEYPEGSFSGSGINPLLYENLPEVVINDSNLHQVLSFIEWIRLGSVREKDIAFDLLKSQWSGYGK